MAFCQKCGQPTTDSDTLCAACRRKANNPTSSKEKSKIRQSVLAIVSSVLFACSIILLNPFGLVSVGGLVCAVIDWNKNKAEGLAREAKLSIVLMACNIVGLVFFIVQFMSAIG